MRRPTASALGTFVLLAVTHAHAADYYVAPNGSDSNPGTMAAPFATLQKGHDAASAGDTVWLREGKYASTKQIRLSKSGQSDAMRINFFAFQGEHPVLDLTGYQSTNKAADVPAILITGNWIHLKGIEIIGVAVGASGDHSISALRSEGASNNTFELLAIHNNFGPGLFISKGMGGNLILNCDSHDNYDKNGSQGDGQNGDGFGVHYQETGPSTIIRGCRSWLNSDDGYDFISQEVPVHLENSWAIQNGYSNGGASSPADGNGNGFKVGSSQTGIRHVVQNCVAWKNKAAGFYANHSSGGNTWLNNTSYMNSVQYNMLASPPGDSTTAIVLTGDKVHKLRNNVGFPNKNTNMSGVDALTNTWDLGINESNNDFVSTMDAGSTGPRQADGSLPAVDFLKLRAGSPLIDKGTDVGLPFVGAAPDLGAYEYGAPMGTGAGGMAGGGARDGGSAGAGGAAIGTGGTADMMGSGSGGATGVGGTAEESAGSGGSNGVTVTPAGSGGAANATGGGDAGGCACTVGAQIRFPGMGVGWLALAFGLSSLRRRSLPRRTDHHRPQAASRGVDTSS
jgi:hypothetical protein